MLDAGLALYKRNTEMRVALYKRNTEMQVSCSVREIWTSHFGIATHS